MRKDEHLMSMHVHLCDAGGRMAAAAEQSIAEAKADIREAEEAKEQLQGVSGDEKLVLQQRLTALEQHLTALQLHQIHIDLKELSDRYDRYFSIAMHPKQVRTDVWDQVNWHHWIVALVLSRFCFVLVCDHMHVSLLCPSEAVPSTVVSAKCVVQSFDL
jgi:hypothetical protein